MNNLKAERTLTAEEQRLAYSEDRLAFYLAKPKYVRHDGKSFGWSEEIAFWRSEAEKDKALCK